MMSPVKQAFQWQPLVVVNGNKNVKENTRKKVSEAIERLITVQMLLRCGLASKKTTTVGVVIPNITNSYFYLG